MTIRVYCCGGAGSNVGRQIKDLDIEVCYVDSSLSNLKGVDKDQIFLVPDQDGAGKNRSVTYNNFKDVAEDVLIKFKPSPRLNIVVSSLSGGTGSVSGPMVTRELIANNHNTIVIGVDSRTSLIELNNSVKTLKTYKAISDAVKRSISLFYVENNSRKEADARCIHFINMLTLLMDSNNTDEFDVSDMQNFINYDRVTDNPPSVTVLDINANEPITPEKNTSVVSTILITTDRESTISPVLPEYSSTCIVTDKDYKNEDIRMDNVLGKLAIIVDELEGEISAANDQKKVNKFKEVNAGNSTEDGVVL